MGQAGNHFDSATRQQVLQAALKCFAHRGYAATSVQEIVDAAKVSKPVLYYYFADKAHLFQALVDAAHDDRYRIMREAVATQSDLESQLLAMMTALLEYLPQNRELTRIGFATAFAAPGELPEGLQYFEKCERNFEFLHALIEQALAAGVLDSTFTSEELAQGFYGQLNACLARHLLTPDCPPNARTAEHLVRLFLQGARSNRDLGRDPRPEISRPITSRITKTTTRGTGNGSPKHPRRVTAGPRSGAHPKHRNRTTLNPMDGTLADSPQIQQSLNPSVR